MKPFQKVFFWMCVVAIILFETILGAMSPVGRWLGITNHSGGSNKAGTSGQNKPPRSAGSLLANLEQAAVNVLKALPDRATVRQADFQKTFGQDTAEMLDSLDVTEVRRSGSRLYIKRAAATVQSLNGVDLTLTDNVAFDVSTGGGAVELKNVNGVQLDLGSKLPNLDLKEARITRDTSGNTVVSVKLQVSRWLPYIPYTITLDKDGNPVP